MLRQENKVETSMILREKKFQKKKGGKKDLRDSFKQQGFELHHPLIHMHAHLSHFLFTDTNTLV